MEGLWTYLLYLYGIFMDVVLPCENPVKLHANELNRDQYLGRWLFIAAASSSSSSLETFASVDSTLFSMNQTESPERLQLRAAIRLKTGQCVPKSWSYLLKEESADLATEEIILQGRQEGNILVSFLATALLKILALQLTLITFLAVA